MKQIKKLIEVALPLEAINKASAREKSIRHGHPSTLHLWWARRPLAAARAVIFAQMVDDPSSRPELFPTEKAQEKERKRLFKIMEDLVLWESTTNTQVLEAARAEIWGSWRRACTDFSGHPEAKTLFNRQKLPAFHDPFAGGGALPLEAQRLGLEAYASDLNPVAVMINKAMIEIPPEFANKSPVHPQTSKENDLIGRDWRGAQGLAEDVRFYGQWMRREAEKLIGQLYPQVDITEEMAKNRPDLKPLVGNKLTVIAWLWARTVKSPNPAISDVDVPLSSNFLLSTKPGKEVYVEPTIDGRSYTFTIKYGKPPVAAIEGTKAPGRGSNFKCLISGVPISGDYIKTEGQAGRIGARLMAIVAEGNKGRLYISPTRQAEETALNASPTWRPSGEVPPRLTGGTCVRYGMKEWGDLFTSRQLLALTTFSDLVQKAREQISRDVGQPNVSDENKSVNIGAQAVSKYADAVALYLAFGVDKLADRHSTLTRWDPTPTASGIINTFSRQALPMTWDYAEGNPFSEASGNFEGGINWIAKVIDTALPATIHGTALPLNASTQSLSAGKLISTDPPYYDNISYADLSDFFYVWLRRSLKTVFPESFTTLNVPKAEELVATPYRHGSREKAEQFFLEGMTYAMHHLAKQAHPAFPVTIYYAFKQAETVSDGTSSTGWETFLDAVIRAGFALTGTWPIRTELSNRMIGSGTNALASSIVLVCRPRAANAPTATRRDFHQLLRAELPEALKNLQRGNIAPVDLAQAAIGPGMGVFTRYTKVLDAAGNALSVKDALALINQTLDEVLAEQEGDFDADSRWALAWFEQFGFSEGEYGVAETLSKAKNTSLSGLVEAGILLSKGGKVRLKKPTELPADWRPDTDDKLTAWEIVHHLVRALETGGEQAAAILVEPLGSSAEAARELAYRLYTLCERKKRAAEALSYNNLVQSWPEINRLARQQEDSKPKQDVLFQEIEEK